MHEETYHGWTTTDIEIAYMNGDDIPDYVMTSLTIDENDQSWCWDETNAIKEKPENEV